MMLRRSSCFLLQFSIFHVNCSTLISPLSCCLCFLFLFIFVCSLWSTILFPFYALRISVFFCIYMRLLVPVIFVVYSICRIDFFIIFFFNSLSLKHQIRAATHAYRAAHQQPRTRFLDAQQKQLSKKVTKLDLAVESKTQNWIDDVFSLSWVVYFTGLSSEHSYIHIHKHIFSLLLVFFPYMREGPFVGCS